MICAAARVDEEKLSPFDLPDNQALFGITIRDLRTIEMDRFDAMRVFTRVVERRSFTLAADDLGLPRSTVTDAVKQLEARLGVRLLQRTTRQVRPTLDGEAYYRRCLSLIADLEDAEGAFGGAKPKGLLRLDVQGTLARHFLLPSLPDFFARISRHRDQHERERPLDRPDPRRRRLRAALRPFARQRHDRAPGGGAGAADLRRAGLSCALRHPDRSG